VAESATPGFVVRAHYGSVSSQDDVRPSRTLRSFGITRGHGAEAGYVSSTL